MATKRSRYGMDWGGYAHGKDAYVMDTHQRAGQLTLWDRNASSEEGPEGGSAAPHGNYPGPTPGSGGAGFYSRHAEQAKSWEGQKHESMR